MQVSERIEVMVGPVLTRALEPEDAAAATRRVLAALDLSALVAARDDLEALLVEAATGAAESERTRLRVLVPSAEDFALPNEAIVAAARARAAELVGKRVLADGSLIDSPIPGIAITENTRDMLRGTITEALREGWSRADLITALEGDYAFSKTRAVTIARTEISKALLEGDMAAARASGVVAGKQSILGSEHDIDDECDDAAAAGVIGLDEAFPPGDDAPPYHPRCVCSVLYALAEE